MYKLFTFFVTDLKITLKDNCQIYSALLTYILFGLMGVFILPQAATPQFGAGLIWITALLATVLAADHLHQVEFKQQWIEHWHFSAYPMELLILMRWFVYWLTIILPLLLVTPVLGFFLNIPYIAFKTLIMTLCIGLPGLLSLVMIISYLTIWLQQRSFLLFLLIIALFIPLFIFAMSAIVAIGQPEIVKFNIQLLAACSLFWLSIAPWLMAWILKKLLCWEE